MLEIRAVLDRSDDPAWSIAQGIGQLAGEAGDHPVPFFELCHELGAHPTAVGFRVEDDPALSVLLQGVAR